MLFAIPAALVSAQPQPSESPHRPGPKGLEAWTLHANYAGELAEYNQYPATLIIARHGHIVRRIEGDPFVWSWMFSPDGRRVAYESGPLHFGLQCVLTDIQSGRRIDDYNCYRKLPDDAPNWVKALEANPDR